MPRRVSDDWACCAQISMSHETWGCVGVCVCVREREREEESRERGGPWFRSLDNCDPSCMRTSWLRNGAYRSWVIAACPLDSGAAMNIAALPPSLPSWSGRTSEL